jgi:hypothetical protein
MRIMNQRSSPTAEELPPYQVTCVEVDQRLGPNHPHVTFIETRDPDGGRTRWSHEQVLAATRQGERFVLAEGGDGTPAVIEPGLCPHCPRFTLLVHPPGALPQRC